MDLSLLIPVRHESVALQRTLRCLLPERGTSQVLVLDREGDPALAAVVAAHPWVTRVRTHGHRSCALNQGLRVSAGRHLLFLEPGDLPERGWSRAASAFAHGGTALGLFRLIAETERILPLRTRLSGLLADRDRLLAAGGFREVPEFEVPFLLRSFAEAGAPAVSLRSAIHVSPRPAFRDALAEHRAAATFLRSDALDPVRCRRERCLGLVLGPDWAGGDSLWTRWRSFLPEEACVALEQQLIHHTLRAFAARETVGSLWLVLRADSQVTRGPAQRVLRGTGLPGLLDAFRETTPEGLCAVRSVIPHVEADYLKTLCDTPPTWNSALATAEGGEWAALWLSEPLKAAEALLHWNGNANAALTLAFLRPRGETRVLPTQLPRLRNLADLKEAFYRGWVDLLP